MGIYGFGKAFNTRYVMGGQYSRRPHVNVRGGRPVMLGGSSFTKTTNVTINNGPTGFWGFMSGLFGGLFGGGLFGGGLFGGLFGGGMGMGMGMSPFGMINQAQMPVQNQPKGDRLADLQKMFPDWVITSDGNGHYDAVNKDQTIHEEGNFDEMCDKLLKHKKEEPQGPKAEEEPEKNVPTEQPDGNKPTEQPDGNKPTEEKAAVPPSDNGNTKAGNASGTGEGSGTGKVHVANGWYRSDTKTGNENIHLQLSKCDSAAAVVDKLLSAGGKMDFLSATDRADLTKKMISYNPSIFNADGSIKANANWDKLDLPSIDYLRKQYVEEGSKKYDGAQVSYKSKTTGAQTEKKVSNTQEATRQNKTKAYTATITFKIHTMGLNQGSGVARFTDSTGRVHTYTASTGASWNATNARKDIAEQIRQQIAADGFTNVTLKNPSNYEF